MPARVAGRKSVRMDEIETEILRQVTERGAEKSICPSEVARALSPEWRTRMTAVRQAAVRLAQAGRIDILRKGKPVAVPGEVKGVIRLRLRGAEGGGRESAPPE